MATESHAFTLSVRPDWLFEVSTLLQRALCEEAFAGDIEGALLRALSMLPLPAHRAEELALSGLLLQTVWGGRGDTRDGIASQIRKLISTGRPRKTLSLAQRTADHIARHSALPLQLRRLARRLGCDETNLRRAFRAEYGTSPREYHQRLRVRRALILMAAGPEKTFAIARAVGYASESHFYKAVRRLTGRTPTALRSEAGLLDRAANLVPRRESHSGVTSAKLGLLPNVDRHERRS